MLGMFRGVGLSAVSAVALLAGGVMPQPAIADNECLLDTGPGNDGVATAVDTDGGANATGSTTNTACGPSANASGAASENSAFGYKSDASGGRTFNTAIGTGANASSGFNSSNVAVGHGALAMGSNSNNVAIGDQADAFGDSSFNTAVGAASSAKDTSAAFGAAAKATHVNSSAFGPGAETQRDNQQVFGDTDKTNTYTMTGIATTDSQLAQNAGDPKLIVTSDSDGNLAAYSIDSLGLNMQSQINNLGRRDDELADGIAIALALAQPMFQPDQKFAMRVGWGNFDGTNAVGLTAAGVLSKGNYGTVILDGGIGTGTLGNMYGGRAGLTLGW